MSGTLAQRTGLAAAGLTHPRGAPGWLARVRDARLSPGESAATLLLVYRLWLVALLLKALGSGWDVAWHFRWLRDDLAPPHDINLLGDGLVLLLVIFHLYTRFGVDLLALRLMCAGTALFVGSAPLDLINHRLNGLDITSWSLTHFGLYTGTAIMIAGAIRGWSLHSAAQPARRFVLGALWLLFLENALFPNQHQEYGVAEIASWDRNPGHPYAEPELLAFAARQIGRPVDRDALVQFSLPVPDWLYPWWITVVAMLTLVLARRSLGHRWSATILASAYVGWRCLLWPLFAVTGFPTSAVPFLLIGGAVMVDLAFDLRRRFDLPWLVEAGAGAAVVTAAVYLGAFVQGTLLMAPPIGYWGAPWAALALFAGWSLTLSRPSSPPPFSADHDPGFMIGGIMGAWRHDRRDLGGRAP